MLRYDIRTGVKKIKTKAFVAVASLGLIAGGGGMSLAIFGSANAMNKPVTITAADPQGWGFYNDNGTGGGGSFVNGPGTPPLGSGSAQLFTNTSSDGYLLYANLYGGTKLSDLTTLSYSTYVQTGNNTIAPSLQFDVTSDVTSNTTWQGRLVYEPYYNDTVKDGQWQSWNATTGMWWLSHSSDFGNICPQSSPCTINTLLSHYSKMGVRNVGGGGIGFKAGSGWTDPFVGNVDAFTIGVSGNDTTYNFESSASGHAQNGLPFKSSGQGTEMSKSPSGCQFTSEGCTVESDGTATSSHMGTGPYVSTLTVHWAAAYSNGDGGFCAPASGPSTITAANGDTVDLSNVGTVCEVGPTAVNAPHTYTGTYTITGGTGHFAGATGSGTSTGGDDGSGNSYYTLSGTISYKLSRH